MSVTYSWEMMQSGPFQGVQPVFQIDFHFSQEALRITAITGDSSVGRASACRMVQTSDGPWFDSGSPDVSFTLSVRALGMGKQGPGTE